MPKERHDLRTCAKGKSDEKKEIEGDASAHGASMDSRSGSAGQRLSLLAKSWPRHHHQFSLGDKQNPW